MEFQVNKFKSGVCGYYLSLISHECVGSQIILSIILAIQNNNYTQ